MLARLSLVAETASTELAPRSSVALACSGTEKVSGKKRSASRAKRARLVRSAGLAAMEKIPHSPQRKTRLTQGNASHVMWPAIRMQIWTTGLPPASRAKFRLLVSSGLHKTIPSWRQLKGVLRKQLPLGVAAHTKAMNWRARWVNTDQKP